MTLKQFASLPVWLMVRGLHFTLPETHPWKHHRFTLKEWTEGQTELSWMFNYFVWLVLACNLLLWVTFFSLSVINTYG
jgi:hypothetical protein